MIPLALILIAAGQPSTDAEIRAAAIESVYVPSFVWQDANGLHARPTAWATVSTTPAPVGPLPCNSPGLGCRDSLIRTLAPGERYDLPAAPRAVVVVMQSENSLPWRWTLTPGGACDIDLDGDTGTDADIAAFFAAVAGLAFVGSADFDGDGDRGTDADIERFWRVLGGG